MVGGLAEVSRVQVFPEATLWLAQISNWTEMWCLGHEWEQCATDLGIALRRALSTNCMRVEAGIDGNRKHETNFADGCLAGLPRLVLVM